MVAEGEEAEGEEKDDDDRTEEAEEEEEGEKRIWLPVRKNSLLIWVASM